MSRDLRKFVIGVLFAVSAGCNGCFGCKSPVDQPGSTISKSCDLESPAARAQKLDVLFVIDNSGSMREEQEAVASELTAFVSALRVSGGIVQDLRVGVITTSVYSHTLVNGVDFFADCASRNQFCTQSGKLQPVPELAPDGGVLLGTGSERVLEADDPNLVEKFGRLVRQGTSGSGQETPFEALRLALTGPLASTPIAQGGNGGFLRDGARLLIVVLSDEDDCSENFVRPSKVTVGDQSDIDYCRDQGSKLTPVADYYDIFSKGLKDSAGTQKEVIYTVIGPVGIGTKAAMGIIAQATSADGGMYPQIRNIDCPTSIEPGYRHREMAGLFYTDLSNLDSICKTSYRDTLLAIANLAGVSQTLEVTGIPDEHLVKIEITRTDNTISTCTIDNGGIELYDKPTGDQPGKFHFGAACKRRRDDQKFAMSVLCAY